MTKNTLMLVGIGASAGGLEALKSLLGELTPTGELSYLVAQHMDPKHPSMLRELLSRATPLPVIEASDGQQPQPDTIYITPPGYNITLQQGSIHLEPVSHIGPKPSVDIFFASLAEAAGERAIGIILSGTGSDGTHGIRAIKAAGGITFSQDEQSAKYNGMPRSAIETGLIDLIGSPEQIAHELIQLPHNPLLRNQLTTPVAKTDMERIFQLLLEQTECDFSNYKQSTLQRRLQRRMAVHKLDTLNKYVTLLNSSPKEVEMLYKDILISVTEFFRDDDAFDLLHTTLEKHLTASAESSDTLRIWVPGCATGEEAYSIAILLDKILNHHSLNRPFQIFATDIDMDALAHARRGAYLVNTVRHVPENILENYFQNKDDIYTVSKHIRERVVFARQDLVRDPPFSRLDLIACRNVLIYFNSGLQKRIISMFHYVLKKDGFLFLGKSESVGSLQNLFIPIDKRIRLFQREEHGQTTYPVEFVGVMGRKRQTGEAEEKPTKIDPPQSLDTRLDEVFVQNMLPATVIVDGQGDILHIRGDVSHFLSFPSGRMNTNLLKMVKEDLRIDVRALLHKSRREGRVFGPRILLRHSDPGLVVRINILPLPEQDGSPARLYAVMFVSETFDPTQPQENLSENNLDNLRIHELEQELLATREHLQTTIEELETSNEELQSTNEELQSANEELQSTNEEMETANEELQSTNEELSTVNQELQIKSAELASVNADLENILSSLALPVMVVDNRLRVTRFTNAARSIFDIKHSDIGQVITSLGTRAIIPDMRNHIYRVIEEGSEQQHALSFGGRQMRLTITPYYSEHRRIVGAVLVFEDKSDITASFTPQDSV